MLDYSIEEESSQLIKFTEGDTALNILPKNPIELFFITEYRSKNYFMTRKGKVVGSVKENPFIKIVRLLLIEKTIQKEIKFAVTKSAGRFRIKDIYAI